MDEIKWIRDRLLSFYELEGRDYPWRKTNDLYKLLVTEVLLKRTNADKVVSVWENFFINYPDAATLSNARTNEIQEIIHTLGLQSNRSKELKKLAFSLIDQKEYNYSSLIKVKSIGQYTVGAVGIQIMGEWTSPPVDVNVERLFSRFLGVPSMSKMEFEYYKKIMDTEESKKLLYGILDFSALVCRPSNPKCEICVLSSHCRYPSTQIELLFLTKHRKNSSLVIVLSNTQYKEIQEKRHMVLSGKKVRNKRGFVYVKVPKKAIVGTVKITNSQEGVIIHSYTPLKRSIPLSKLQNSTRKILFKSPMIWVYERSKFENLIKKLS